MYNLDEENKEIEKVACIMIQGSLGNIDKLIDLNGEEKKISYKFLDVLEDNGVEFFGTSIRKGNSFDLEGILTHVDKEIPFVLSSLENLISKTGLSFDGKYALATYSPDDDNLNLEVQKF